MKLLHCKFLTTDSKLVVGAKREYDIVQWLYIVLMQLIKDFITILEEIFQDAFKNAQTIEGFSYNNKSAVKDLRCKSFTCYPYYAVNSKNFYSSNKGHPSNKDWGGGWTLWSALGNTKCSYHTVFAEFWESLWVGLIRVAAFSPIFLCPSLARVWKSKLRRFLPTSQIPQ